MLLFLKLLIFELIYDHSYLNGSGLYLRLFRSLEPSIYTSLLINKAVLSSDTEFKFSRILIFFAFFSLGFCYIPIKNSVPTEKS